MPRALSAALCSFVKTDLESGILDVKTLMSRHRISDKKARTMKNLFLTTGEVNTAVKKKSSGRRRKLNKDHEETLRRFLHDHPDAFLRDMCQFMEDTFGLTLTESTMQRTCTRIGWKLKKQPRQRDEQGFWIRTLPRDDDGNAIRGWRQGKKRPSDYGSRLSYTGRKSLMAKTRAWVQEYMSQPRFDPSHDYDHILRVLALSLEILRVEQNTFRKIMFDSLAIELSVLMHDIDDHKYRPSTASGNGEGYPTPPVTGIDPQQTNPQESSTPAPVPPNEQPPNHPHNITSPSAANPLTTHHDNYHTQVPPTFNDPTYSHHDQAAFANTMQSYNYNTHNSSNDPIQSSQNHIPSQASPSFPPAEAQSETTNPYNAYTNAIDPNLSNDQPQQGEPPPTIEDHLLRLGWPPYVTSKVAAIVPFISYTAETTDPSGFATCLSAHPELAIIQDADRLDAIGATGIGRAFTYGGAKNHKQGTAGRGMAGTLEHFGSKLINLEARMKTGEGRRLAVARAERLRIFGRWWQEEMRMVGMGVEGMEWVQKSSPWAGNAAASGGGGGGGVGGPQPGHSGPLAPPELPQTPAPQAPMGNSNDNANANSNVASQAPMTNPPPQQPPSQEPIPRAEADRRLAEAVRMAEMPESTTNSDPAPIAHEGSQRANADGMRGSDDDEEGGEEEDEDEDKEEDEDEDDGSDDEMEDGEHGDGDGDGDVNGKLPHPTAHQNQHYEDPARQLIDAIAGSS